MHVNHWKETDLSTSTAPPNQNGVKKKFKSSKQSGSWRLASKVHFLGFTTLFWLSAFIWIKYILFGFSTLIEQISKQSTYLGEYPEEDRNLL